MQYKAPADLLKDRIILVTGAGDGLGKAAAQTYAAHGAVVILLGRTLSKLEQVYDAIEQSGYPQPAIYPMNLEGAAPKDYQDLASTLDGEFGRLDGLLLNAAQSGLSTPIKYYDVEMWHKIMQVNLNAPFMLIQSCLTLLEKSADPSIVFALDDKASAYWGAYGVSKGGLATLMHILADELDTENQIRVNGVNPGPVRTRLRNKAYPGEDPGVLKTPADVMGAYLYLMGHKSRGVTRRVFGPGAVL